MGPLLSLFLPKEGSVSENDDCEYADKLLSGSNNLTNFVWKGWGLGCFCWDQPE